MTASTVPDFDAACRDLDTLDFRGLVNADCFETATPEQSTWLREDDQLEGFYLELRKTITSVQNQLARDRHKARRGASNPEWRAKALTVKHKTELRLLEVRALVKDLRRRRHASEHQREYREALAEVLTLRDLLNRAAEMLELEGVSPQVIINGVPVDLRQA